MKRISLIALMVLAWAAVAQAQTEDAVLDTIQHRAFGFFWNEASAANGLIRDRSQSGSPCSIASLGFGLSAIAVGIDRGWVTRAEGSARVRTALESLWAGPQGPATIGIMGYKGLYYHFLNMTTGYREWSSELSTIDTALLFAGIIDAKEYFSGPDADEVQIRALADSITRRADWEWTRNLQPGIEMGWKPGAEGGFGPFGLWTGYNEAMILYILALGSPTHPVPASSWTHWTSGYVWGTQYGQSYVLFPPLFGHQYSHCWIDFSNLDDVYMRGRGITYFENSRRATLAQRAYAIANPLARVGYADNLWGLTASDTPTGYAARGAPPTQNDDGTITPTAPLSSIPFAPEVCLPVMWKLWNDYRSGPLWGPYGFRDAFNLTKGLNNGPPPWYDPDYIGIDEGPMVLMIENYRTGSIWNRFMRNLDIQRGLVRAGFVTLVAGASDPAPPAGLQLTATPHPFRDATTVQFRLAAETAVRLTVYDVAGREVARLVDGVRPAGVHSVQFRPDGRGSGLYLLRLQGDGLTLVTKCARIQ